MDTYGLAISFIIGVWFILFPLKGYPEIVARWINRFES